MNLINISTQAIVGFFVAAILALGLVSLASPAVSHAQANTDLACEGLQLTGGTCDDNAESNIGKVIETVINVLSIIVGAISVIMIVIGGLRYVLSSGDSSSTANARNSIIYALVGLVIVIFAQVIVAFVITEVEEGQ